MTIDWSVPPVSPHGAPPPPRGPGVRTPFAVPPTERDRRRLWLTLGIGGALLVLCCGVGAFGVGALAVAQTRALRQQATSVVHQYLDGLSAHDYVKSYGLLCAKVRRATNVDEFTRTQEGRPQVSSYVLEDPQLSGQDVTVNATITVEGGGTDHRRFTLSADSDTAQLRICRDE
jgi:hypothetical protein